MQRKIKYIFLNLPDYFLTRKANNRLTIKTIDRPDKYSENHFNLSKTVFSDKLITLLTSFSKVERNRFRKYLLSPYLNDQPDATRLFDLLDEQLRQDATAVDALTKEYIWTTLYTGKKFDDAHLRRLASDLSQLALRFMVAEARQADAFGEALDLQKVLEKPQLKKQLAGVERQMIRLFDETEVQSTEFFLAQFKMHHHIFSRASKVVATIGYGDKLATADYYLESFYIIQKLKYYVAWLQFSGIRATEKIVNLLPGFWDYLEDPRFENIPLITVYKRIVKCFLEQEDEQHFNVLTQDIERYAPKFTKENLRECYYMAQNYCALKINQGRTNYYTIYFNLQKKLVELGLLLENKELSEAVFKNMITIGLSVGEFKWTENFIHEYYPYLPADIRENAKTFNLANLYSHQKKYDKVIELLSNVEYSDIVYTLGAKLILLKTYYESKEFLAMDSLIDSFRIFVRRNKLMSKNLKREYINFLNFLSRLGSVDKQRRAIYLLKKRITDTQHVTSKKWLLEKISEL